MFQSIVQRSTAIADAEVRKLNAVVDAIEDWRPAIVRAAAGGAYGRDRNGVTAAEDLTSGFLVAVQQVRDAKVADAERRHGNRVAASAAFFRVGSTSISGDANDPVAQEWVRQQVGQ
jgi:hypothetical protein